MKKKIFVGILILLFIISGCKNQDKYSNYKHYTLDNLKYEQYEYIDDFGIKSTYLIADITPSNAIALNYALLYKVNDNDYILLKDFWIDGNNLENFKFFQNKLYTYNCINEENYMEYTLNKENIIAKTLPFDESIKQLSSIISGVKEATNESVYYKISKINNNSENNEIKCSLSSYKCEYINN